MKAHELIEILKQCPDAEILTTSDDNWSLQGFAGANLHLPGANISGVVDSLYNSEETKEDGEVLKPIFILW